MAKMQIIGDPFKDLALAIDKAGGNLKVAADEALTETGKVVQANVTTAAAKYAASGGGKGYTTGEMFKAIKKDFSPVWVGSVAKLGVGFDLHAKGGYHSIFLMYGTPRIQKDTKLYNAIRGSKTKKSIAEVQQNVMNKYLKLGGN